MKLAEALQERADLNRKIDQLENRLCDNVLVQEGENSNEDPEELFKEFDDSIDRLEELIARINLTNSQTTIKDQSLTELIAAKDVLQKKISIYKEVLNAASKNTARATRSEIKVLTVINVRQLQKKIDRMSKQYRELDNLIQQSNWNTDLK